MNNSFKCFAQVHAWRASCRRVRSRLLGVLPVLFLLYRLLHLNAPNDTMKIVYAVPSDGNGAVTSSFRQCCSCCSVGYYLLELKPRAGTGRVQALNLHEHSLT